MCTPHPVEPRGARAMDCRWSSAPAPAADAATAADAASVTDAPPGAGEDEDGDGGGALTVWGDLAADTVSSGLRSLAPGAPPPPAKSLSRRRGAARLRRCDAMGPRCSRWRCV